LRQNSNIRPLKRFGQNYLSDKNILAKIAGEVNPLSGDIMIEIGPGNGSLTGMLWQKSENFYAVEIDKRVIELLKDKFPQLNLITEDFLKINLNRFVKDGKKIRIAGNIPYNITSPIIFKLIENRHIVQDAVFMIQYEVAKRITAECGTKDYGIFSVILNTFADVKFCFKVSPNVFYPKPKVFSAVIHINFKDKVKGLKDDMLFIKVVKACFSKRRKILKNSLSSSIFADVDFQNCPIDLSHRAEQLTINDFINLTNFIQNKNKKIISKI
jgi:16S rRNA (adenine1518-N6/adenine1519-N6)-dimethyltransferase